MEGKKDQGFVQKFSHFVINNPYKCMIVTILLVAALAPGLAHFAEDYNVRTWFRETDPNIKQLDKFEKKFGNDENLVLVIHSPSGIFDKESIEILREITEKTWLIHQVLRVDSLINYNYTYAEDDDINVEPFLEEGELTPEYLLEKKETALSHKVMPEYLISKDGKSAMIFARLVTLETSPDYERIVIDARKLLEPYENKHDHTYYVMGEAAVNDAFREIANNDAALILPILFALIIFYLVWVFRSLVAMILPLVVTIFSVVGTLGFCFYIGYKFTSILSILPGILIAISIADTVHVMVSYFQFRGMGSDTKEAAFKALDKNLIPTFLTTVSTMIGFLSLSTTELQPIRQLGLLAAFGCALAWLVTIFLIVPWISKVNFKVPKIFSERLNSSGEATDFSRGWVVRLHRYTNPIVIIFSISTVVCFYIASQSNVNSNPYEYFKDSTHIRKGNDFVRDAFGGNAGPEIVIESGKADGIKDPDFLRKVEKYKERIDSKQVVNKTIDIVSIIKDMNKSLYGGHEEEYKLPDTQKAIAEQLFLYSMSLPQGMDLNNRMTLNKDALRMSLLWSVYDSRGWLDGAKELEVMAEEEGLDVFVTGKFLLFQRMMDYVVETFFKSVTMALVLVALLMMIVFRSFKLGILSLVPNVLPLIFGGAFMKLMDIDLNIGSSLVASVCLGIAVDDTIHFLSNFYRYRSQGYSLDETIAKIYTYTGSALIVTTAILASGFGLYMIGDFIPNVNFGMLCAVILSVALVVDLVFLPALLIFLNDKKEKCGE
ncbi:MAG: putative RND superfamily exporter protein [Bacteriovoracaceae bacterium]|jgi:predicted RND superfamily exporter protein